LGAKALAGRRILVTRPREQAERLATAIEAAGGEALRHPTVEIAPPADVGALARTLERLGECDLAIFVSPTAVLKGVGAVAAWPARVEVAAVGPGTGAALGQAGFTKVLAPRAGADSETLLAEPELRDLRGRRVILFRGAGGRDALAKELAARGAEVRHAECYRRVRPQADLSLLAGRWRESGVDAVTAFSAGALENLFELLAPAAHTLVAAAPLFASHERIAEHAHRRGVREVIVAGPGDDEMLRALLAYFGGGK
jgi:uroporphyrinogen-III synthase